MNDLFDLEAWRQIFLSALTELGTTVAAFLPKLVGTLFILLIGWLTAKVVEFLAHRLLGRMGLDRASSRLGVSDTLDHAGISRSPAQIIARLLFWLLMLTFVLTAFENLGLDAVTTTIDRLIAYLPNVVAAALMVILGLLLAQFLSNLVSSGAAAARFMYPRQLGSLASGATVLLVAVLATEQLGVDTRLLVTAIAIVLGAFSVALALAFSLGARDVVRAILAGHYLRQSFAEGEHLVIEGKPGVLERVGPTVTLLRDGERTWSFPNADLLQSVIERPGSGSS